MGDISDNSSDLSSIDVASLLSMDSVIDLSIGESASVSSESSKASSSLNRSSSRTSSISSDSQTSISSTESSDDSSANATVDTDIPEQLDDDLLEYVIHDGEGRAIRPYQFHVRRILTKAMQMNDRVFNAIFRMRKDTFEKLYQEIKHDLPQGEQSIFDLVLDVLFKNEPFKVGEALFLLSSPDI